ncbi:acetyl-CoA acetyltransferase [Rhodococcus sp. WWJCD1]|uniref:acetyl-CoA C-acyltransferase n=1 Tax=unclassified Rhodococcus (in: high G+C Gram-positive bacteria) TaxID=192944 RepID=UPI000B9B6152|nr:MULTISPECIES: acetyl-CoA C-acyltransferase [unclassified Rhodococcus (in: high G+C Gram-positive bacteria)]OZC42514.1 acetyl-CoA acetyltransferase [Rhodococcus sp. WWJCD1]OZE89258.1 acetyl-CoA acetyltransferase [Rhodococcus sp. 15-2388-1-1a]
MTNTVLVAGARTPIGKLAGALSSLSAVDLGAHAIRSALGKAKIDASMVDAVIMGNVVQAGVGPNPARLAAAVAGIPLSSPAVTINNLCLSGLQAIIDANRLIESGDADIVVAGGMESMTNAPYLARGARTGFRYGSACLDDALDRDALTCGFDEVSMGEATDRYMQGTDLDRANQDSFAVRSHTLAATATKNGSFGDEIVPVEIKSRRGPTTVTDDEGIRGGTTVEALSTLRPAFLKDGVITAGSSSQLSDGAAAVVLMSKTKAQKLGIDSLAELGASAFVAGPDTSLLYQPAQAITKALQKDGLKIGDLDQVEINEAFAGVVLASVRQLGLDMNRVNINGGAIALGHPVGMSGARLALSLAHSLNRRGGGTGAAALCGGGGQGNALLVRAPTDGARHVSSASLGVY